MNKLCRSLGLLLLIASPATLAQNITIEDLAWMDRNHIAQQVERVDELARTRVGSQIREDLSDLTTLQRIVDRELVPQDDRLTLQALGAVMGNVMAAEVDKLEWKVYEDKRGRSRALCVEGTEECLFPITMLSRRMEVGLKPDVRKVYREALELIEPYLPELPYGGADSGR